MPVLSKYSASSLTAPYGSGGGDTEADDCYRLGNRRYVRGGAGLAYRDGV